MKTFGRMSHIVTMASSIPSLTSSACLRGGFLLLLGSFLHVLVQIGIHVRCLIRAVSGKVTLLLAESARVVRRQRAVLGEVPELAATVALVVRLRLATALVLRSRIRLRARVRPVALFTAAVAHVVGTRLLPLASRSVVVPSARAVVPALPREVSESSTNSARTVVTTRSRTTVRHHRRRTRARVVSQPSASRASVSRSRSDSRGKVFPLPRSSRVRQRALTRPVTDLSASVASIGPSIRRPTASLRTVSRVMPRLSTIPTRIVRPRPRPRVRGVRGVRPSRTRVIVHPFAHVSPRAIRELGRRRRVARWRRIAIECRVFCPIPMRPEDGPATAHVRASVRGIARGSGPKARASGRCERYSRLERHLERVVRSRRAREAREASNGTHRRGSSAPFYQPRRRRWCAEGTIAIGDWMRGTRWRCGRIAGGW